MSALDPAALERFSFDTVFEGDRVIAPAQRARRTYAAVEVEAIRAESILEGERRARESLDGMTAHALAQISAAVSHAMPALATSAHAHRVGAAELALAAARTIAGAALEQFPEAPAQAALEALAREIEAEPRLNVRVSEDLVAPIQKALNATAEACGYAGAVLVKADPDMAPAAFTFDWGEGRAEFDPQAAADRVETALTNALAADGLHAEPLPPAAGPSPEDQHD